jgi:hypothetical protein
VSRSQQYNARADIFSLGMCMYNLFNRTIPTIQILLNGDESHLELYALKVNRHPAAAFEVQQGESSHTQPADWPGSLSRTRGPADCIEVLPVATALLGPVHWVMWYHMQQLKHNRSDQYPGVMEVHEGGDNEHLSVCVCVCVRVCVCRWQMATALPCCPLCQTVSRM